MGKTAASAVTYESKHADPIIIGKPSLLSYKHLTNKFCNTLHVTLYNIELVNLGHYDYAYEFI